MDVSAVIVAHEAAKKTITRSELVFRGKGSEARVYTPVSGVEILTKAQRQAVEATYFSKDGKHSGHKSDARKQQILAEIRVIRESARVESKNQPITAKYVAMEDGRVYRNSAPRVPAKRAIQSLESINKFINKIFNV